MTASQLRDRWYRRKRWRCPRCESCRTAHEEAVGNLQCLCHACGFEETSGTVLSSEEIYQLRKTQQKEYDPEWWARYDAYLRSPAWTRLRDAVRQRCNNVCEHCHQAPMQQAHHLTYDHVFHEQLTDLLGVCCRCHDEIGGVRR